MPRATLVIAMPEAVWIGDLSRRYPAARFRILAAIPKGEQEAGAGLLEVTASDLDAVLSDLAAYDAITEVSTLQRHDDRGLVQFETTMPLLLLPIQSSGVPLEMPFDIVDGEATWEITAPSDRISALGDQLRAFGIQFSVAAITQEFEPERLLTDRQRRVVAAAVERGYYETPRRCSLTELAEALDIAKSTCSEILHRAEGAIITRFVADVAAGDIDAVETN